MDQKASKNILRLLDIGIYFLLEEKSYHFSDIFFSVDIIVVPNAMGNGSDMLITFSPNKEGFIRLGEELDRFKVSSLFLTLPPVVIAEVNNKNVIPANTYDAKVNKFGQAWFIGIGNDKGEYNLKFFEGFFAEPKFLPAGKSKNRKLFCDRKTYAREDTPYFEVLHQIKFWGYNCSTEFVDDDLDCGLEFYLRNGEKLLGLTSIVECLSGAVMLTEEEIKDGISPLNSFGD